MRYVCLVVVVGVWCGIGFGESGNPGTIDILQPATQVVIERKGERIPFASAKEALAAAVSGDVVLLGPGTHRGPLVVQTSGITLSGIAGARVNANSDTWKPEWKREPQYGPYAWSSPIPFQPVTMSIDQRVMIDMKEDRGGLAAHEKGIGRNGRVPLQGLFTWVGKTRRVVVSFARDLDPAKHLIEAAPLGASAIKVRDANDCVIQNLILTGGASGVLLQDTKNTTVRNCLIYGTDAGVRLYKGASFCKILGCDITWNSDAVNLDCDPHTIADDVWYAHKRYGSYDKFGISIDRTGENNEIAGNYIHEVWNGITTDDGVSKSEVESHYKNKVLKGIAEYNRGLKVHHNRIDLAMDEGLEPGNELVDHEWYSNVVTRARCAARLKTIMMGPFFFYDNLLLDSNDGMRLYKSSPPSANVYIFHNVIKFPTGVIYHKMDSVMWDNAWLKANLPKGTPNHHLYNNLFICNKPFGNSAVEDGQAVQPNYHGDYNLYTSRSDPNLVKRGIDVHSVFEGKPEFVDAAKGDYRLKPDSAGKGAGVDPKQLNLGVKLPEALTAVPPGKRPDAGLLGLDFGKTPHGPVSGLWALAQKQLNLGERDFSQFTIAPLRWVTTGKCDFLVKDLPVGDELLLAGHRASGKSYKITVKDEKGAVLATKDGYSLADKDGFKLPVPLKGAKQLTVSVDDEGVTQWRLDAGGATVGIDAGKGLSIRKYDGGRYIFDYPIAPGVESFTVSMHSKYPDSALEIARPGGKPERVDKTVKVETRGVAGVYRILVTFTKGAEIQVTGPETMVFFNKDQEAEPIRQLRGKPGF
ncbi:MAG TPA: hypothetical protein DCX07_14710 [Phycisphaerales bacterium]|nr:hypothetical protein [Phycisphaerales bacterium]